MGVISLYMLWYGAWKNLMQPPKPSKPLQRDEPE